MSRHVSVARTNAPPHSVNTATHVWTSPERNNPDQTLRSAVRHGRRVRALWIGIPVGIVGSFAAWSLAIWLSPPHSIPERLSDVGGVLEVSGSRITMDMPRFAGWLVSE